MVSVHWLFFWFQRKDSTSGKFSVSAGVHSLCYWNTTVFTENNSCSRISNFNNGVGDCYRQTHVLRTTKQIWTGYKTYWFEGFRKLARQWESKQNSWEKEGKHKGWTWFSVFFSIKVLLIYNWPLKGREIEQKGVARKLRREGYLIWGQNWSPGIPKEVASL